MSLPLLSVQNLTVEFPLSKGFFQRSKRVLTAVNQVSFAIPKGTTLGIVGESGSGKTTLGRAIIRLAPMTSGTIFYQDVPISTLSSKAFFPYRKKIQMIFQDPFNSLNPHMTIESMISEPLEIHFKSQSKTQRKKRVCDLLDVVGLDPKTSLKRYPHEFSGGQRQRIGIARALAVEPELIICDEPVSSLDVSVQATIINLLQDLQKAFHLTYLFIAHDMAIVEHVSDHILVMYQGNIVEQGSPDAIYHHAQHPYTQNLIHSVL